jgi:hypothetical protein
LKNRKESSRIKESIILLSESITLAEHVLGEVQSDYSRVCPRFCKFSGKQATAAADVKKDTTSNRFEIILNHLKLTMPVKDEKNR